MRPRRVRRLAPFNDNAATVTAIARAFRPGRRVCAFGREVAP